MSLRLNLFNRACLVALGLTLFLPFGVGAQDVALTLTHRTINVGNDGITRTAEYQERFVRHGKNVWMQRVLPKGVVADHADHAHGGRRHFDFPRSARWIQAAEGDAVQLQFVDLHDRVTVDVDRANYADVGFDGGWQRAYFLVEPKALASLTKEGPGPSTGTAWYSGTRSGSRLRILWDEQRRVPREVHSDSLDGRHRRSMSAAMAEMPSPLPWARAQAYERKGYNDFLD